MPRQSILSVLTAIYGKMLNCAYGDNHETREIEEMSLIPDPETSYMRGYQDGKVDSRPSPDNHKYQTAYMTGYRNGKKETAKDKGE